jgi:hypothetical protein
VVKKVTDQEGGLSHDSLPVYISLRASLSFLNTELEDIRLYALL